MELLRQHVTALSERVHRQADGSARARDDEDDGDRDGGPHQRLLLVQRFGVRKTLPAEHSAIDEDAFDDLGVAVAVDDERYRVEDDQRDDPAHVFEGLPGVADVGGVAVRDAVNEGDQDRREVDGEREEPHERDENVLPLTAVEVRHRGRHCAHKRVVPLQGDRRQGEDGDVVRDEDEAHEREVDTPDWTRGDLEDQEGFGGEEVDDVCQGEVEEEVDQCRTLDLRLPSHQENYDVRGHAKQGE